MQFEWDKNKNLKNIREHRVDFEEAKEVFEDPYRLTFNSDSRHSTLECREVCIGKIEDGICTVRFVRRNNIIRIIGAGFWRKERRIYEEKNKIH